MKPHIYIFFSLLCICSTCKDPAYYQGSQYTPVLMERTALETSIKLIEPQAIINSGKIYIKDNYLFINEKFKGIHIIDNSDPTNPIVKGFITIPGNIDISMDGEYLYADNAVDLVTIQFSEDSILLTERVKSVFPELSPPDMPGSIPHEFTVGERPENTVIVNWE